MSGASPYIIIRPTVAEVPIVISIPHCGTTIPDDLIDRYRPEAIESLDDADFFVDQLYGFARDLGITMIASQYHRWVIDLNRHPQNTQLYDDGRMITALAPTKDFHGKHIYKTPSDVPDNKEISRRAELYYHPYHNRLRALLEEYVMRYGQVILWEAHSIRRYLPLIHPDPFPDLILGDDDGKTASKDLVELVYSGFQASHYSTNYNLPFKGGYITRSFGRPMDHVHAIQIEMTKDCYMKHDERVYDHERAEVMSNLLIRIFEAVIKWIHKNEKI